MAAPKVEKSENEMEKLIARAETLHLDGKSYEQDLRLIATGLEEIFKRWELESNISFTILQEIRSVYVNDLGTRNKRPDFSERNYQWCYMYLFMLNHSYLLFHAIKNAVEKKDIKINPDANSLNVCVIGGGPGSDILGLCLLLHEKNCEKPWLNNVSVLEKFEGWRDSWQEVNDHMPDHLKQGIESVNYFQFDFQENALSSENKEKVKAAHVVTMVKSLSSAAQWVNDEKSDDNSVYSILDNMKEGAILLYLDNLWGQQHEILNEATTKLKFKSLHKDTLQDVEAPKFYEGYTVDFRKELNWNPMRKSKQDTFQIWQKPGAISDQPKLGAN